MSVLSALRACVSSGTQPRTEGDVVHLLPGTVLPRKSATAWRYRKGGYLDLESIVFFLDNEHTVISQYVKACTDADVQIVPFGERKLLLEYLRGDKHSSAYSEIDQDREQHQEHKHQRKQSGSGPSSRRSSAPFLSELPSRPSSTPTSVSRARLPVFLPSWAWWWLLLSSLVQIFDAVYLALRPHSLPNGSLHHFFAVYDTYLLYDPSYAHIGDPFTRTLAIAEVAQILVNLTTLLLATTLPHSAWPALLAVTSAAGVLSVTAYFFLYEALSGSTGKYQLGDMSTWDVGYALGYVGTTGLWIVFPLAIIVVVGWQFVHAAERLGKASSSEQSKKVA